jgi:hypothetical protein
MLDYPRSFVLSAQPLAVIPARYTPMRTAGGHFLYYRAEAGFYHARRDETEVILLGHALSPDYGPRTGDLVDALRAGLDRSDSTFFDELDRVYGRFALVCAAGGRTRVLHDASGLRTVFYAVNQPVVATHARLVAEVIGIEDSDLEIAKREHGHRFKFGYPGISTPYRHVKLLTPNTLLEFPDQTVTRYFPRENLTSLPVREVILKTEKALKAKVDNLVLMDKPLVLSLSGGIDSRMTLAVARRHAGNMKFFTYGCSPNGAIDPAIASHIARVYKLDHVVLPDWKQFPDIVTEEESLTARMWKLNYYYHMALTAFVYRKTFGEDRYLHVRSNLAGTVRAFYHTRTPRPELREVLDMVRIYSKYQRNYTRWPEVIEAFREFWEVSDFERIFASNYDPLDLFYWEFRMGQWHGALVLESDIAFDTHALLNSRDVLTTMLGAPLESRMNAEVSRAIIYRNLPRLDLVPFNPPSINQRRLERSTRPLRVFRKRVGRLFRPPPST